MIPEFFEFIHISWFWQNLRCELGKIMYKIKERIPELIYAYRQVGTIKCAHQNWSIKTLPEDRQ